VEINMLLQNVPKAVTSLPHVPCVEAIIHYTSEAAKFSKTSILVIKNNTTNTSQLPTQTQSATIKVAKM
jgi:hypothetical protein